eukprot:9176665-Pyramimonas_sp.AAC.1
MGATACALDAIVARGCDCVLPCARTRCRPSNSSRTPQQLRTTARNNTQSMNERTSRRRQICAMPKA